MRLPTVKAVAHVCFDGSVRYQCNFTAWRDGDVRARPSSVLVSVVDAVVVETVLEARGECSDGERARAALNDALLAARAPAHGGTRPHGARAARGPSSHEGAHWTVTMTVATGLEAGGGPKSVAASIVDDAGTVVAQRTLTDRSARACLPLARAVGAWASLVLDAEMNRATDDDEPRGSSAAARSSGSSASASSPRPDPSLAVGLAREGSIRDSAADSPTPTERKAVELGTMVYLRNGLMTTGGIAGLSPFITVELTPSWVLRPALFFGRSTEEIASSSGESASMLSHLGGRTDICRRIPGNYIERRGIEADLCAGLEGGVVTPSTGANRRAGRMGAGPSVNMRGELGAGVALEIRGLVGANILEFASQQTPLVFASGELGMSVRFR